MQEQRHKPPDRSTNPLIKEIPLERHDHKPLREDSVSHGYAASDDPSHPQGGVLPVHAIAPFTISLRAIRLMKLPLAGQRHEISQDP
jgi:hypothetical protein